MKSIIIYQPIVDGVNGTNTAMMNFLKSFYKDYEITVVCDSGNLHIMLEFSKYANVYIDLQEELECDYLIFNRYDLQKRTLELISSKHKPIQIIHCDFNYLYEHSSEVQPIKYFDCNFVTVSKIAQKGLKDRFNIDSVVIDNIVTKPNKKKWLRLISATRLDESKGFSDMVSFARLLKKNDIPYQWDAYTNSYIDNSEELFNLKKPIMNVDEIICNYDYLVIFSKSETFSYNIHEALISGVPVLTTKIKASEIIENGVNGYVLPFGMNIPKKTLNDIVNKKPVNFEYKETKGIELWKKMLK